MEIYRLKLSREEVIKSLEELHSFLMDCISESIDESLSVQLELHKWIASLSFALMELRENETSRSK